MTDYMDVDRLSSMNANQRYILNTAECLLIELAYEKDLTLDEIQDKTQVIGSLATDVAQRQYLIQMLQSRAAEVQHPQVYNEILQVLKI